MSRYAPWRRRLGEIEAAGRTRALRRLEPTGPASGLLDSREVLVACSNDYLGLAWDPEVRAAATGGGAGASRLISGSRPAHHALEEALEERFGRPALLFGSGWHANVGLYATVCEAGDRVASDALNHASIIDGLRLGRAERVVVPHADPDRIPGDVALVVVEGLFSMDGDVPPLDRYPAGPWLAVDEAHAVGAMGPGGRGAAAALGVTPDIVVGTFGKAYGAAGAFVVGPPELKALLINTARSFIFSTAMPEPVARMALAGLRRADDALRERLAANTRALREGLADRGWRALGSAHIVPIVAGPRALELAEHLLDRGVFAPAIRWPTVPKGLERIRLTASAAYTDDDIERICDAFGPAEAWANEGYGSQPG